MAEHNIANYLRTDKPVKRNGKYSIHLRVCVRNKEKKLTTKLKIDKEHFPYAYRQNSSFRKEYVWGKPLKLYQTSFQLKHMFHAKSPNLRVSF